jgi:hypothetical protein
MVVLLLGLFLRLGVVFFWGSMLMSWLGGKLVAEAEGDELNCCPLALLSPREE